MTDDALILIVDDDAAVGRVLEALVKQAGMRAVHAPSAEAALAAIGREPFDLVITDLRMPGMDGMTLLQRLAVELPDLPVVILTAHGTVPLAVEAMRLGAADFILKPFDRDELLFVLDKVLRAARTTASEPPAGPSRQGLVVESAAMREVWELAERAAATTASVLVRGETGVGKEGIARSIHDLGPRRDQPFVKLHCAAFPETLLESELFGYEKGAFTGASHRKPGRVELAQGGTLFLDEIGEIAPSVQAKLLRLLQDREIERLGSTHSIRVDVRIVAATHRPLERMIKEGAFREDLFYRLAVVPIVVPPLRERPADVPALLDHFLRRFTLEHGRPGLTLDEAARERLTRERWPGNVRELQNFVERLVVLAPRERVAAPDVERELARTRAEEPPEAAPMNPQPPGTPATPTVRHRRSIDRDELVEALARAHNNRALAARILGVSRRTLYNKLAEHALTGHAPDA